MLKSKVTLVDWGPNGLSGALSGGLDGSLEGKLRGSSMKGDDRKGVYHKEQGLARETFHTEVP